MPITPITREALPYVRPAYEPETRTLRDLMMMAGQSRAQQFGRQGQSRADGLMTLGQILSQGLAGVRQDRERQAASQAAFERQQREDAFKMRDQQLREADILARIGEREDAAAERQQAAGYKRGSEVAEEVGYGQMSEQQMGDVLQGPAAGRARYVFGPGTAEGPELQPTQAQRRGMETEKAIQAMGGQIGPNGQVVMPPKPEREPNPTEASLAMLAAQGNVGAQRALEKLRMLRAPQANPNGEPLEAVIGPDGNAVLVPRSQARGMRPAATREQPSEDERKAAGWLSQAQNAFANMEAALAEDPNSDEVGLLEQYVPIAEIANRSRSAGRQKYAQAAASFAEAALRAATGAGMNQQEAEQKIRELTPQRGDVPELRAQKRASLQVYLDSLRSRASRALPKDSAMPKPSPRVRMQAPDGSVQEVDPSMVDHYAQLGAKVIK